MTTRRDYLVTLGLAKPGRGKFSRDALAALDDARAKGTKFSDDEPKPEPVKREKSTNSVRKEDNYGEVVYTFPEASFKAYEKGTKIERSMRAVCYTCRVSLVGHGCKSPSIVSRDASGPVFVEIVPR